MRAQSAIQQTLIFGFVMVTMFAGYYGYQAFTSNIDTITTSERCTGSIDIPCQNAHMVSSSLGNFLNLEITNGLAEDIYMIAHDIDDFTVRFGECDLRRIWFALSFPSEPEVSAGVVPRYNLLNPEASILLRSGETGTLLLECNNGFFAEELSFDFATRYKTSADGFGRISNIQGNARFAQGDMSQLVYLQDPTRTECSDGYDNDFDGNADLDDEGCQNILDYTETTTFGDIAINRFVLVDADNDTDVFAYDPLFDGAIVNLQTLGIQNINIKAEVTNNEVQSVLFGYEGNPVFRLENEYPYSLFGDNAGDYFGNSLSTGWYEINATPYTGEDAQGQKGITSSIRIFVVGESETSACGNGIDDDGDGKIDFGYGPTNDPGCSDPLDNDETDPADTYACSDGIDNDGDGFIDFEGLDLDGDDIIGPGDFAPDVDCMSFVDDTEVQGQNILGCGILGSQGQTYVLAQNIDAPAGCINITADDITLLGVDKTITYGTADQQGHGIHIQGANNVEVRNLDIRFGGTTQTDRAYAAVHVVGDANRLFDVQIESGDHAYGVFVNESTNTVLDRLNVNNQGRRGVDVLASDNTTITNSVFRGSGGLRADSGTVTVESTEFRNSGIAGEVAIEGSAEFYLDTVNLNNVGNLGVTSTSTAPFTLINSIMESDVLTAIALGSKQGVVIDNNLFTNMPGAQTLLVLGAQNINVSNNIFINASESLFCSRFLSSENVSFVNNVLNNCFLDVGSNIGNMTIARNTIDFSIEPIFLTSSDNVFLDENNLVDNTSVLVTTTDAFFVNQPYTVTFQPTQAATSHRAWNIGIRILNNSLPATGAQVRVPTYVTLEETVDTNGYAYFVLPDRSDFFNGVTLSSQDRTPQTVEVVYDGQTRSTTIDFLADNTFVLNWESLT